MISESKTHLTQYWKAEAKRYQICCDIIDLLGESLSDEANFSPSYFIQITVKSREDLAALMTLAPTWSKSFSGESISYEAKYQDEKIVIGAWGDALPGTCKMVEEEYEIPAQPAKEAVPATKAKKMVLKCDHAKPELTPVTEEVSL